MKSLHRGPVCFGLLALLVGLPGAAPALSLTTKPHVERSGTNRKVEKVRPIKLMVAMSPSLHKAPRRVMDLSDAVAHADSILRQHLGRPLRLTQSARWPLRGRHGTLEALLLDLVRTVPRGEADIVVGLATRANDLTWSVPDGRSHGLASYGDGSAVLVLQRPRALPGRLLAHELGHLFGAIHVDGQDLLMDPKGRGEALDQLNASLIQLHRQRRFTLSGFPLEKGLFQTARSLYQKAADSLGPATSSEAFIWQARLDVETGEYDDATTLLEALLETRPENLEAQVLLGIAYRRSLRYAEALQVYGRVLQAYPENHRVHYNRALALRHSGDLSGAIEAYEQAVALAPQFTPALSNLAEVYAELGRTDDALESIRRALAIDPDDPAALDNLGYVYLRAGDYEAARKASLRALSSAPGSASAYNTLGQAHEAEGKMQQAIAAYRRALEVDSQYPDALLNLAQADLSLGHLEEARGAAERAVQLQPRSTAAHLVLGRVHLGSGQWREAGEEFGQALEIEPASATALGELGYAYLIGGDLHSAQKMTRRALDLAPHLAWAWVNLGVIAARLGDLRSAARQHQRAIDEDPHYAAAYLNLGHTQLGLGDTMAAEEAYRRALELEPPRGEIHNNLAIIYYRRGELERAWRHALKALSLGFELNADFVAQLERAAGRRLESPPIQ